MTHLEDCGAMTGNSLCTGGQSSYYSGSFPWRYAVDNNLANFMHTVCTATRYWWIDFGSSKDVQSVTISSRKDCCWMREDYEKIYVGDSLTPTSNNLCGTMAAFPSGAYANTVNCKFSGRYLFTYYNGLNPKPDYCMNFGDINIQGCTNCPLGTAIGTTGSTACQLCGVGAYADQRGTTSCSSCPQYFTTSGMGSISYDNCTCIPTFYRQNSSTCSCNVGKTFNGLDTCVSCNIGYYKDQEGCKYLFL
mmetsp:Transcript_17128/g.56781  ORF Transcript_17128/g.56781 Transcript_17128/m.56781 type:complete len:248 (+) Transcript_17128:189-932(+)